MYDCIIIGAGPAGLMCASQIKNKKVLILEKNDKPGKKLMLTGNGRCNITNLKSNNEFLEHIYNKKFLYSAINNFGPQEIYNYFTENNVPLKEEDDNRIFPKSDKALDILNVLKKNNPYEIRYNEKVINIKNNEIKEIITTKNTYKTKNIVIATGGASFPQTGSTGDHIKFSKEISQNTIPLHPKETSIIIKEETSLEGVALNNVIVSYQKNYSEGPIMFTKNGLSAKSIMNISGKLDLNKEKTIKIDLLPSITKEELTSSLITGNKEIEIETYLSKYFPKRLSSYLTKQTNIASRKLKTLNKKEIESLVKEIKELSFEVVSLEKLTKAFITGGGIDMKYINSKTMESTINKGIYFIGEALDIDGPIGGYNLTLALSTGYTAGTSINEVQ